SGPPIEHVGAENTEGQRHRKRDRHGMDRVTQHGNLRFGFIVARQFADRIDQFFAFFSGLFRFHFTAIPRYVVPTITLLTLTGCEGVFSTVDPAGPAARTIAALWWVML